MNKNIQNFGQFNENLKTINNEETVGMDNFTKDIVERAEHIFIEKMKHISWEICKWMQYSGSSYNKISKNIILHFDSSRGIKMDVPVRLFFYESDGIDIDMIDYESAYQFFRKIKYSTVRDYHFSEK